MEKLSLEDDGGEESYEHEGRAHTQSPKETTGAKPETMDVDEW